VDVNPDEKPRAKTVRETRLWVEGGRERDLDGGGLLGDLNIEGLVIDEILAAQMEILAENEVSDSGGDTVGGDSGYEGSFKGKEPIFQEH
jgi:hypothetical protein